WSVERLLLIFFFFFQAEDGIRDGHVTGVQTCALPILARSGSPGRAMHDPLAVATFIDRGVVRLREYLVAVETQGELKAGETVGYMKYLCANQRRSKTCPLFPKPLAQPLCPSRAWRWRWTQHDSSRCSLHASLAGPECGSSRRAGYGSLSDLSNGYAFQSTG